MNIISPLISLAASRMVASARVGPSLAGFQGVALGLGIVGSSALALKQAGVADGFLLVQHGDNEENHHRRSSLDVDFAKTLGRIMIVPGLLEELVWRVAMTPVADTISLQRCLCWNAAFALYHLICPIAMPNNDNARKVFCDPVFLVMAFVLGNSCSMAYYLSGYALWAPVLLHSISVTVWLKACGGEEALRGGGRQEQVQGDNNTATPSCEKKT